MYFGITKSGIVNVPNVSCILLTPFANTGVMYERLIVIIFMYFVSYLG